MQSRAKTEGSIQNDAALVGPPLALRPREAAKALSISQRLLWTITSRGQIPHVRVGRAVLYPVVELKRWLSEQTGSGVAS